MRAVSLIKDSSNPLPGVPCGSFQSLSLFFFFAANRIEDRELNSIILYGQKVTKYFCAGIFRLAIL